MNAEPHRKARVRGLGLAVVAMVVATQGASTAAGAGGTWSAIASLPAPAMDLVGGEIDGLIYVTAGRNAPFTCSFNGALWAYDPGTDNWSTREPLGIGRDGAAGAVLDGLLYVTGGSTGCGVRSASVDAYDPANDAWNARASLPTVMYGHALVALDGRLYALGGHLPSGLASTAVLAYDPVANGWSSRAPMPRGRAGMVAAAMGGRIHVVAGAGDLGLLAEHDVYDPATDTWSTAASPPVLRSGRAGTTFDGRLWVIGGRGSADADDAWAYDPVTDTWTEEAPILLARQTSLAVAAGGALFLFGGHTGLAGGSAVRTECECYAPAATPPSNHDPIADAGDDVTVECASIHGTEVELSGLDSYDPDGDAIEFLWTLPAGSEATLDDPTSASPIGPFPVGVTMVTLTVTDGLGGLGVDDVIVTVVDMTAPVAHVTTDVGALWPPNHAMVAVEIRLEVSDACFAPATTTVVCVVSSSEPDGDKKSFTGDVDGYDGYTVPVAVALQWSEADQAWVGTVELRAERDGRAGRTYSIVCDVEDGAGNATSTSCAVVVPHDRRK